MLHINDLTYRIEGRVLLDHATAGIPTGHKVGLVGRNGTGKTTLLRLMMGEIAADDGSISMSRNSRIGTVAQEAPGDDHSLIDTVLAADKRRAGLLAEAETAQDPHRIAEIQIELSDIGAHSAPARAATILAGLGFDDAQQQRSCSEFSGGWRMRVALASVLFTEPDFLLLDEPTNYLDLEGTIWLENYLRTYPYTVIIVSHDRDLLNKAVDGILHLENCKLTFYTGGYDRFERTRREQQALQLKLKKKQDDARRHMQDYVDRFRYKASKARQAQSRLKALSKMEPVAAMVDDHVVPFRFTSPEKMMNPPLIRFEDAAVGYVPGQDVLRDISLRLDPDDRIGLLGANGNGKSTFAKLLAGRLETSSGHRFAHKKMTVGYFAQHQLDELNPADSPYDHIRSLMPTATEAQVRTKLGSLGFGVDKVATKAANLSGGEKARLLFALASFHSPHLLILDEPTNHLDVDSRQALIHAINDYDGAVILISHDRHLIETSADRLWLVDGGGVSPFEGDMDDYRRFLLDERRKSSAGLRALQSPGAMPSETKQEKRRRMAEQRARLSPLKKKIGSVEKMMAKLEGEIALLDDKLGDKSLYENDPETAAQLAKQHGELKKSLAEQEAIWIESTDAYEEARSAQG